MVVIFSLSDYWATRCMHQRRSNLHFIERCLFLCVHQWCVFVEINMNNGNAIRTSLLEGIVLPILSITKGFLVSVSDYVMFFFFLKCEGFPLPITA